MKGVRRGISVQWGHESDPTSGVVLDKGPNTGTWWVMPFGRTVAEEVRGLDLRSVPNRRRAVADAPPLPGQGPPPPEPLSTAEPGDDDVPLLEVTDA